MGVKEVRSVSILTRYNWLRKVQDGNEHSGPIKP
jgi:hypothetical protein